MFLKNWKFWLLILILALFVIWLKFGGRTYEFVGLKPLYETRASKVSHTTISTQGNVSSVSRLVNQPVPITQGNVSSVSSLPNQPSPTAQPGPTSKTIDRRSHGERTCCEVMERIYGKPFKSVRPKWLRNPETNSNLELDCYNDDLKIAVEYNGSQHYKYPNQYHNSESKFIGQVRRDQYKFDTCEKNGVYIIRVPYTVPYNQIEKYIRERLPDKSDVCKR
jgi:hypothetical protein